LASRSDVDRKRIGSIGWCMGGGYSLAAALNVDSLAAAVVCYGRLVTDAEEIKKIGCPVLGIFGEEDRGIPAESVREFEKAAKAHGKDVETGIYKGAGHAFMNPSNKSGFREKVTQDAWSRIYKFLDSTLKRSGEQK
jgi:carboxymethylenebutenolidase